MELSVIVTICIIIFLAGFVQGLTGFGGALVAIPLLSFVIRLEFAVSLLLLNGLIITSYMAFRLRETLSWKRILPMALGAIPGSYFGFLFLVNVDQELLKAIVGGVVLSYGLFNLLPNTPSLAISDRWGVMAGLISGGMGSSLSIGGPPIIIYSTLKSWNADEVKSTLSGFFCISTIAAVSVHAGGGIITSSVLTTFAITSPFIILGAYLGLVIGKRLNRESYFKLVNVLLIIVGFRLILAYFEF